MIQLIVDRPSEERLFAAGWKDECYFFGDPDCYVTLPQTARERRILNRSEANLRGYAVQQQDAQDSTGEEDENSEEKLSLQFDRTEEDCYLPLSIPKYLHSLAVSLRESELLPRSPECNLQECLFDRKKRVCFESYLTLAGDYLFFPLEYSTKLFARGLTRAIDPVLTEETPDPRLFLDYLPLLRTMSVYEQQPQQQEKEDDAARRHSQRPSTRSSSRLRVRRHYLTRFLFACKNAEGNAKQVGSQLAKGCLALAG